MQDKSLTTPSVDPISDILKWILLVVAVLCFALLGYATVLTYREVPPQPQAFTDASGKVLMTADDIVAGKGGFQKADLMDYGSIYGMGSYFGEDYTASTLARLGVLTKQGILNTAASPPGTNAPANTSLAAIGPGAPPVPATPPPATLSGALTDAAVTAEMQKQLQAIDLTLPTVVLPDGTAQAIRQLQSELTTKLSTSNLSAGWVPAKALDPTLRKQTADFIIYSAITTVARRPGMNSSWTENWPYEPSVGNTPTTNTFRWTWISFCFTFFAMGFVLWLYRAYLDHPDDAPMERGLADYRALTPSQIKTGKYFIVVALVFLASQGAGAIMAHSYYDRETFYGVQLNYILPFNFLRSFHLQAPIVWIGLGWIASGLFIAPAIAGGREAKGQGVLVDLLFWVSLFVVAAALTGNYLGIQGKLSNESWFWFGNQGLSYIELGRFWQILFFVALLSWSGLMFRALWPSKDVLVEATRQFWTGKIRLEHLIWAATINVAVLYMFGMIPLTGIEKSFTLTDFWRWWVVHLWVEQSFEFFAVAMSAYLLMSLGLVSRKLAERSVYLELILIFLGGVLGTGHHLYWAGAPSMWVPLGTMFSFIEVLPLVLLILEAISQHRAIKAAQGLAGFDYGLAYLYILGSAFWNFVGAGVFGGGTLNAPLVNYYEHGTFLTLNHAHTALFGAFGLLALGLIYFCLRYRAGPDAVFSERPGRIAFWLYNLGLVMWICLNFFPIGWPQLDAVYEHGLAWARSQAFYDQTRFWQWMRLPGDVVFSAGALLMSWDFLMKLRPPRGALREPLGRVAPMPAE